MCVRISPLLLPRCYRHPTFSYFSYKRSRQSATTSATYIPSVYYTDCVCTSKKLSADEIVYTVHPARAESGLVMAEHAARELEGMHACMRRRSIANPHRRRDVCMSTRTQEGTTVNLLQRGIVPKISTTLAAKASATRGCPTCCWGRETDTARVQHDDTTRVRLLLLLLHALPTSTTYDVSAPRHFSGQQAIQPGRMYDEKN